MEELAFPSKINRRETMLHQVMELVVPKLHWSDAIAVGATSKDFQWLYREHSG